MEVLDNLRRKPYPYRSQMTLCRDLLPLFLDNLTVLLFDIGVSHEYGNRRD